MNKDIKPARQTNDWQLVLPFPVKIYENSSSQSTFRSKHAVRFRCCRMLSNFNSLLFKSVFYFLKGILGCFCELQLHQCQNTAFSEKKKMFKRSHSLLDNNTAKRSIVATTTKIKRLCAGNAYVPESHNVTAAKSSLAFVYVFNLQKTNNIFYMFIELWEEIKYKMNVVNVREFTCWQTRNSNFLDKLCCMFW